MVIHIGHPQFHYRFDLTRAQIRFGINEILEKERNQFPEQMECRKYSKPDISISEAFIEFLENGNLESAKANINMVMVLDSQGCEISHGDFFKNFIPNASDLPLMHNFNANFVDHGLGLRLIKAIFPIFFQEIRTNDADFSFLLKLIRGLELTSWTWSKFWGEIFGTSINEHMELVKLLFQKSIALGWKETFLETIHFIFLNNHNIVQAVHNIQKNWRFREKMNFIKLFWKGVVKFDLTRNAFVLDRLVTLLNFLTLRECHAMFDRYKDGIFFEKLFNRLHSEMGTGSDSTAALKWHREMILEYMDKFMRLQQNYEESEETERFLIFTPQNYGEMKKICINLRKEQTDNCGCIQCGLDTENLKYCNQCNIASYCGTKCQTKHWKKGKHKKNCKKLAKMMLKIKKQLPKFKQLLLELEKDLNNETFI